MVTSIEASLHSGAKTSVDSMMQQLRLTTITYHVTIPTMHEIVSATQVAFAKTRVDGRDTKDSLPFP